MTVHRVSNWINEKINGALIKRPDYSFFVSIGRHEFSAFGNQIPFLNMLEEKFSRYASARAKIFEGLYVSGIFSDWIDGFGVVEVIDLKKVVEYQKDWEQIEV